VIDMQDDYPLPDDGAAEEQRLREAEQAKLDEAASEDAELIGHAQDARDALDPYAEKREALGFDLAWWAEDGEHGTPPIDIAVDLAQQACGRTHYFRDLERFEYDPTASTGYIGLNAVTGPLVVAGLQILGVLHSHIRDEIEPVLKQIFDAVPEATEETMTAFDKAANALQQEQFANMGINIGPLAALFGLENDEDDEEPQPRPDANLN
jgi:hypothetical protein